MSWTGNITCYFFLFAKLPMVKTNWENCSRPSRFRSVQVNIYHVIHSSPLYASLSNICFIIQYFMISANWVVLVHSPQCSSPIYIYFPLTMKRKISWTKEFRFPYANKIVGIYKWRQLQSSLSFLSAMAPANQPVNWSSVSFNWEFFSNRWVLSNNLINTLHSRSIICLF